MVHAGHGVQCVTVQLEHAETRRQCATVDHFNLVVLDHERFECAKTAQSVQIGQFIEGDIQRHQTAERREASKGSKLVVEQIHRIEVCQRLDAVNVLEPTFCQPKSFHGGQQSDTVERLERISRQVKVLQLDQGGDVVSHGSQAIFGKLERFKPDGQKRSVRREGCKTGAS